MARSTAATRVLVLAALSLALYVVDAFVVVSPVSTAASSSSSSSSSSSRRLETTSLFEKRKRKRRRKTPVGSAAAPAPPVEDAASSENVVVKSATVETTTTTTTEASTDEPPAVDAGSSSPFRFDREEALSLGVTDAEDGEAIIPAFAPDKPLDLSKGAVQLPSFADAVKKKSSSSSKDEEEEEEEEKEDKRIRRGDIASLKKLLEVEPMTDAGSSFFVDEEYGVVSALLAEGSKPFLGIPSGPLQVGHFVGSLGIVLMAFVDYPGFPLTNLPDPLRGALQGGLGVVYAVNSVLAVLATFAASERGQPAGLWAAKCFSVGGLAYDQLTQLPTKEETAAAARRRSSKKNKGKKR